MRFVWLSMLFACGSGSGGGGVSPADLPARLADVTCSHLAACCTTEEFMDETLGSDDEAECRALFTGFGGLLANVIEDSIAAGRLIYHADRMADCFAALDGLACTEFQQANNGPFPGQCEDPFEGQVAPGGECANDFDCTSEYCSGDSMDFEGNITFGACADAPIAGQPCDDGDCADGTFCDFATDTCADPQADGAPCNDDDECASGGCNGDPGTCGVAMTCDGV